MANRYGLGAAQFELTANDAPMLAAFARSEAAAKRHSTKIAQAIKDAQKEYDASSKDIIHKIRAYNDSLEAHSKAIDTNKKQQVELANNVKATGAAFLAATASITGVTVGLGLIKDAAVAATDSFRKMAQAQFELNATFKNAAPEYTKFAQTLASQTKFTTTEVQASIVALGVLQQNYKLTSDQIKTLTQITAVYATKSGRDMEESARNIQAAIRGEGEAVEKLGLTLGRDFVRNAGLMTDAQKKIFYTLTDSERATIILAAAQKQSLEFQGIIAQRAASDLGTYDKWEKAVKLLSEAYGKELNKALQAVLPPMTQFIDLLAKGPEIINRTTAQFGLLNAVLYNITGRTGDATKAMRDYLAAMGDKNAFAGIQAAPDEGLPGGGVTPEMLARAAQIAKDIEAKGDQERNERNTKARAELEQQIKDIERHGRAVLQGIEVQEEAENKRFQAQSARTQAEKHERTEAAQATKEAAMAAIAEEEKAFLRSSEDKIGQLRVEKEEKLRAASDTKDAAIKALEEERDVDVKNKEEQIVAKENERDAKLRAIDDVTEQTVKNLETEKQAQLDAIEETTAAFQGAKDNEIQAADDSKEAQIRAIDEAQQKSEDYYDGRIEQANTTKENAVRAIEEEKEAQLQALDEEKRGIEQLREVEDRRLEDRKTALDRAHEDHDNALKVARGNEIQSIDDAKETQLRALAETREAELENIRERTEQATKGADRRKEIELRSISDRKDAQIEAIEDAERAELRAFQNQLDVSENNFDTEQRRAREVADARLRGIEDATTALESSHRNEMEHIDDEKDARLEEINARIRAANELQRTFNRENKIQDLGTELDIAKRKGDLTAIARIEEQIRRERINQTLETAQERLKVEKDSIEEEIDDRKDAAQERFRIQRELHANEKQLIKDALEADLENIRLRREAFKSSIDEQRQAIQDRYREAKELIARTYEEEKRIIEDRFAFEREISTRATEEQKELINERFEHEKRRIEDAFETSRRSLEARYEALEKNIELSRRIEDDNFEADKRRIDDLRQKEDDALEDKKRGIDRSFDDEKRRVDDNHENIVKKLSDEREDTKRTFEAHKQAVDDAYDAEKRRIAEVYDDPQSGIFAQLRRQREVTEREYAGRTEVINQAYEQERRNIEDIYNREPDGLIPQIKRAIEATRVEYGKRKDAVEATYKEEQRNIEDTYSKEGSGLIWQQERMARDAKDKYEKRRAEVSAAFAAEQVAIYTTYDHPVSGLIKKQKDAHDNIMTNLGLQKKRWDEWQRDTLENIRKVISEPGGLDEFARKIKAMEDAGYITPNKPGVPDRPGDGPNRTGSDGTGGASISGGGKPYNVLFGYDQPYNGPYGGAAWPNGPTRHRGIDLTLPGPDGGIGTPVGAFREGVVRTLTNEPAGGTGFIAQGFDGLFEYYGHLQNRRVREGQALRRGDTVGEIGRTGLGGGQTAHLHYEVRRNPGGDPVGSTIDPRSYMNGQVNTAGNPDADEILELRPFGPHGAVVVIRSKVTNQNWGARAFQIAKQEDFSNPDLFSRQMRHESRNFDPRVIKGIDKSEAGAIGIAQFMPTTAQMLGVNPYNPIESLRAAAKYMRQLELKYGGIRNALWAYNAGEGAFRDGILYPETRRYLEVLQPYRNGKLVMEPTLMMGLRTGEMGIAGETGQPERLLGVGATASYDSNSGPMQSVSIPIIIGNEVMEHIVVTGLKLVVRSGKQHMLQGINISS